LRIFSHYTPATPFVKHIFKEFANTKFKEGDIYYLVPYVDTTTQSEDDKTK